MVIFFHLLKNEFSGYNASALRQDLLAGVTVAAVALPLALAFGVASGATAAAGLVSAILAGLIIGALSGAPYQISGPTGAMSAVLILLGMRHGLTGIWIAGLMSGALLLAIGLLKLGRFIAYVPAPVITGFTSGIALIIAIGQIDSLLGIHTSTAESAAFKLAQYLHGGFIPDWRSILIGLLVITLMVAWPRKWNARFPASLLGIILATGLTALMHWQIGLIGEIPSSLLLGERLRLPAIAWDNYAAYLGPALSITALGAVESLLCGAVASNMTGIRLQANQELIAQGLGNLIIPFFGGVPATAAIARTSVGIRSGGQTRVVSIVHALIMLASMYVLAPLMSRIPLAALAGVLIVTAFRMNEWESISYIFSHRFKTAIITFLLTMLATITLDLTQAILIGAFLSGAVFLNQSASMTIEVQDLDPEKLHKRGIAISGRCPKMRVAYLTGPLFFAATGHFNEAFARLEDVHLLILSLRAMPLIDLSGLKAINELREKLQRNGATLMLSGVNPGVRQMLDRGGFCAAIGEQNIHWSAEQAILAAEQQGCARCSEESCR